MTGLLLTRPLETGAVLADRLRQEGFCVFHEPLLTIEPLEAPMPELGPRTIIVLTSRAALVALSKQHSGAPSLLETPCYCVGAQTAADARAFGFQDVRQADGDGAALARLVLADGGSEAGRTALHPCGADRTPEPEAGLRRAGIVYQPWVVYKACETTSLSPEIVEVVRQGQVDIVPLFSVRTARVFATLMRTHDLVGACRRMTVLALSENVLAATAPLVFAGEHVAALPDEASMVSLLHEV